MIIFELIYVFCADVSEQLYELHVLSEQSTSARQHKIIYYKFET